ncbi:MAG: IPTL-CTERM sorting domain-containing protein [Candidatus Zixiibacteriota bacterium]|nr:MAG: IPTL-CTERM sorting domain-containing protein [candidate division Zixibacteria bacterium]
MNITRKETKSGAKRIVQNRSIATLSILLLLIFGLAGTSAMADGTWFVETVDADGWVGYYSSLGLDSGNKPHICYRRESPGEYLKYAYHDGSSWNIEIADSFGNVGGYVSLAIASNDRPYVSYFDIGNADLKCRYRVVSWLGWRVDEYGWVGMNTSIALDSNDNIHISYEAQMPSGHDYVKYAYYDGSSWTTDVIEELVINGTSIAVDSNDYPHVIYNDYMNFILKHAYYNGSSWQIDTIAVNQVGSSFSLALDSDDKLHVSFYGATDLNYAYFDGSWQITVIDSIGYVGSYNSIALDSYDRPHISYFDWTITKMDLRYAYYDGSLWHLEVVDTTGEVGKYTSIDLDNSDMPHISYVDDTNKDLKYAYKYSEDIPTLSEWGMLIMGLLLLALGTVAMVRRRRRIGLDNEC